MDGPIRGSHTFAQHWLQTPASVSAKLLNTSRIHLLVVPAGIHRTAISQQFSDFLEIFPILGKYINVFNNLFKPKP